MLSGKKWICTVQDLAQATGGQVLSESVREFSFVGTDSRSDLKHKLFVPLKGERFNAHDFVAQAVASGASVILVDEWREEWKALMPRVSFVRVKETLRALQDFANYWRKLRGYKVMAITGSSGKTTTKEFTYALLKQHLTVFASHASFNNHWGVPITLLSAGPEHSHVIAEMGMNSAGEITRLCEIAEPDMAVVTMVGRAHVGGLGSQQAVANAKEEMYLSSPKAIHIFNVDNEWTLEMQKRSRNRQITFSSFNSKADVQMRAQRLNWDGLEISGEIQGVKGHTWVSVLGRQNVVNLMAASSLALAAGLQPEVIWQGLASVRDVSWGRNQVLDVINGAKVYFDAYNANPDSVNALLKNLYELESPGKKYLILGEMKELGEYTEQAHEEVGERAGAIGFQGIWYVGPSAEAFTRGLDKMGRPQLFVCSEDVDPAIAKKFLGALGSGDIVAIKASRSMRLERVLDEWHLKEPLPHKP